MHNTFHNSHQNVKQIPVMCHPTTLDVNSDNLNTRLIITFHYKELLIISDQTSYRHISVIPSSRIFITSQNTQPFYSGDLKLILIYLVFLFILATHSLSISSNATTLYRTLLQALSLCKRYLSRSIRYPARIHITT